MHIGGNYQFKDMSVIVSVGYSYDDACTDITLSGNFYYYLFGQSKYSGKKPGFTRTGITYDSTEEDVGRSSFSLISPRIDRVFYLFRKGGIKTDVDINY